MKHLNIARILLVLLATAFAASPTYSQTTSSTPLTNASIVKLVKAGFKDKTIISIISTRPSRFDLSPERMIELKRSGVSEKVILAMLSHQEGMEIDDSTAWNDDAFFNDDLNAKRSDSGRTHSGDGSSIDIFGSSGGMKGETRNRNGNNSSSGDTITTGSATVRILKPPSEANAPAKMEKTPNLTNASIIELVEAGFSEGTVIRRIEQSPVEFDLSPNSLDELRKRRVSEKILVAMKAAMGVESTGSTNPSSSNEKPK
jgi:hypothetical protein